LGSVVNQKGIGPKATGDSNIRDFEILMCFWLTVRPDGADRPWKEDPPM